jgi:hypothetical protein
MRLFLTLLQMFPTAGLRTYRTNVTTRATSARINAYSVSPWAFFAVRLSTEKTLQNQPAYIMPCVSPSARRRVPFPAAPYNISLKTGRLPCKTRALGWHPQAPSHSSSGTSITAREPFSASV